MSHRKPENFYSVPINVLSTKTSIDICDLLNSLMIIPADNGLLRDWRGLSELFQVNISLIEKHTNPTKRLLELVQKADKHTSTIEMLLMCLEALNRFDIIDDCQELIDNDIIQYSSIQDSFQTQPSLVWKDNSYDAMVLYAECDVDFAYRLVDMMEVNYDLRLFVKDRDLKAGDREVQATLGVIADHSNKLIVILSPDFLTSPINEFFLDYAQTIAIEQKTRKIIPCVWKHCPVPKQLLGLYTLTYTENRRWGCFWTRLAESIDPSAITKRSRSPRTSGTNETSSMTKLQEISAQNTSETDLSVLQAAKCPSFSNSISCSSTNLRWAPTSTKNMDVYNDLVTPPKSCNIADNGLTEKQRTKTVTAFLNNVTKLIQKNVKKKGSKKQKERIPVAM